MCGVKVGVTTSVYVIGIVIDGVIEHHFRCGVETLKHSVLSSVRCYKVSLDTIVLVLSGHWCLVI